MCESVAQFSTDPVRLDSYLLCTFRRADCGCPRADTLRSAPCGGNCWDALGCACNMHGAPASGCKGGNNLTDDTVEQNSHSSTRLFYTIGASVVQSTHRNVQGFHRFFLYKTETQAHVAAFKIWYVGEIQSMKGTCGESTVPVQSEIRALVFATQLVRRWFNQ